MEHCFSAQCYSGKLRILFRYIWGFITIFLLTYAVILEFVDEFLQITP